MTCEAEHKAKDINHLIAVKRILRHPRGQGHVVRTPSLLVTVIEKLCLYCLDMFYDVDLISGIARGADRPWRQSGGSSRNGVKFNKLECLKLLSRVKCRFVDFRFARRGVLSTALLL